MFLELLGCMSYVLMEILSGFFMTGIVEIHLDRPEAKNAISKDMLRGLRHAFESVDSDPSVNVMMICSSIPKVFCAGADLKVFSFFQLVYIAAMWYNL